MPRNRLLQTLRQAARPLMGHESDYAGLLEKIGSARLVLIGEASHGTHEFYQTRAQLTQRLIAENNFNAVAIEADWPDAYRVNCYVRGQGAQGDAFEALNGFERFPAWMWRNQDVLEFIQWLREYNDSVEPVKKAGFYGLDLYSLYSSMSEVVRYLEKVDPDAAQRARQRYGCFDHYAGDVQSYSLSAGLGISSSCKDEVVSQLRELCSRAADYMQEDGATEDAFFYAAQNARLVKNAEEYYRTMFGDRAESWNRRDRHMVDTLNSLMQHLGKRVNQPKIVVWAHNSHLGDARATEMSSQGELNVGQLVREQHDEEAFLLGFTTYEGEVTAASDWDKPALRRRVRPALAESYEALFHEVGVADFWLDLKRGAVAHGLAEPHLERAIGVIYRPETERLSHYFYANLPRQFDAVIHHDRTSALMPLQRDDVWEQGEVPETFPSGV